MFNPGDIVKKIRGEGHYLQEGVVIGDSETSRSCIVVKFNDGRELSYLRNKFVLVKEDLSGLVFDV